MSEYYRGGGLVPTNNSNVPATGAISFGNFYGAANQFNYVISSNQTNLNLRNAALSAGWDGLAPLVVTINSGVYISSNSTGTPALTVSGSFPSGVALVNNGFIVGMGGAGGAGNGLAYGYYSDAYSNYRAADGTNFGGSNGSPGGPALSVSSPISITNNGTIGGGGGGGGGGNGRFGTSSDISGSGGGGGRSGVAANSAGAPGGGFNASSLNPPWQYAGNTGASGTSSGGGAGGTGRSGYSNYQVGGAGGPGGSWGAAGGSGGNGYSPVGYGGTNVGPTRFGGSGGPAVQGNSNITWVATGTRLGAIA
ncbi:hypothetical protein [Quisquiliibacterium transsilvanicum]|uniref:PE-PGRS family protein n=2 Tax=Quisquiliibacterium transsilvanicum TaxID=1549638 RepID=A0A7W8HHX1_9BURK|nr:hypothetical protein [Quisquiliibacterium transsilvanicum]